MILAALQAVDGDARDADFIGELFLREGRFGAQVADSVGDLHMYGMSYIVRHTIHVVKRGCKQIDV